MDQTPQPDNEAPGMPNPQDRNLAIAAHLGALVAAVIGGWLVNIVVPLVVMLVWGGGSNFVREHAREALNFQISMTIYALALLVFALFTLGLGLIVVVPLLLVLALVAIVAGIRAAMAASRGESYRYPISIRMVQ